MVTRPDERVDQRPDERDGAPTTRAGSSAHPPARTRATSRLRQAGYAAILTALAFAQSSGQMVADTKFDLVTAPRRFLSSALHLWDPSAAFGQLQNQAYGYAWPMGPFFVVGDLVLLPPWVVQRLWWSLLLCVAFFGILRLARRLEIGTPATQVLAAFAYVLTPRITTLLGGVSVEIWPMALAPWVLLPLVRATEGGSLRRPAALSALVVATCGGVNAVAVAAVLPVGVAWLVTRPRGVPRWRLLGLWSIFTVLATAWWWVPLLLLGSYSVPFLDYIENATITTVPTDLSRTLVGESDWVAYFAGIDFPAGQQLVTTPFLLLDAAAVAALGLVGIALRDNTHRRFLTLSLVLGLVLVGFGYAGELSGFLASDRSSALDGALAPLRNLHKFDVVLRIPLVLGLAHVMSVLPTLLRDPGSPRLSRASEVAVRGMAVLALLGLALPWGENHIAPRHGVDEVPAYWSQVADYLAETDDGTVSLALPASAFGVYTWGNTHDDILQGLARSPWAVRNVIPLAQPGNVVALDAVTRTIESGRPSRTLARFLAANGVGRLVVRNDLDRFQTGAPDPAYVRAVLSGSPGLTLTRSFGPTVGSPASTVTEPGRVRVITGNGLAVETGSVDVYTVDGASQASLTSNPKLVIGDPASGLRPDVASLGAGTAVLSEDAVGDEDGQVLTDGTRRRETNFATVRQNVSATIGSQDPYRLPGPEHTHRFLDDQDRWQTTEVWAGQVAAVAASSSQAFADGSVPLQIGSHPGAALDGDLQTAWRSAAQLDPTGQFWQATFAQPLPLATVSVGLSADSAEVPALELDTGDRQVLVTAPPPGETRTYRIDSPAATHLRVTAAGRDLVLPGSIGLSEVRLPARGERYLSLPEPDPMFPVDRISLTRDQDRAACVPLGRDVACADVLDAPGEDGDGLARRFSLPVPDTYRLTGTVSLRRHISGTSLVPGGPEAFSDAQRDAALDVARGPLAAVDGDLGTTWVAGSDDDSLEVRLPELITVDRIRLRLDPDAPASRPTEVHVRAGGHETDVTLDAQGRADLPGWKVSALEVTVLEVERSYSISGQQFVPNPPGVTELTLNGSRIVKPPQAATTFPCGSGPEIRVGATRIDTAVRAPVADLLRGASVPFEPCQRQELALPRGTTDVLAEPSDLFRVDGLSLTRSGATTARSVAVTIQRDRRGAPVSASLPVRSTDSVLSLAQNVNAGWTASLDGRTLEARRVDGWKQGWIVPAGDAGRVTFRYEPSTTFRLGLLLGGVGALICLACALLPDRGAKRGVRAHRARGATTRPGLVDAVVVLGAGSLLAGWWGLAAFGLAAVAGYVLRRSTAWALLAGLAMVAAGLGLSWDTINAADWANEWRQAWSLAAVACVVAALASGRASPRADEDDAEVTEAHGGGAVGQ